MIIFVLSLSMECYKRRIKRKNICIHADKKRDKIIQKKKTKKKKIKNIEG